MAIKLLDGIVASRIAAGEVVEKPASALRELLDNSIDAKASKITVYIEEGGIKSICIIDNGCGIDKEDLALACKSHATSKISTLDDLFSLTTLGFRGEALSSISSCSTLTISSKGYSITVDNGVEGKIIPCSVSEGTTIRMDNLFERIPARKQFLRRPSSEAQDCRKVFLEKALGFENVEFMLFEDGKLTLQLTPGTKKERALSVMELDRSFVSLDCIEYSAEREPVKLYAISSGPSCYKRDRTQIKILINNRVIDCYPFVQAITNAYSAALPGGAFPFFYLFIEDSPTLIDFNIHPAKRECKIRNQSFIYSTLTIMIRDTLLGRSRNKINTEIPQQTEAVLFKEEPVRRYQQPSDSSPKTTETRFDSSWFERAKAVLSKNQEYSDESCNNVSSSPELSGTDIKEKYSQHCGFSENNEGTAESVCEAGTSNDKFNYIGQVFNTFLVVEKNDRVLFVDQHAAHERLLYDEITSLRDIQQLIVPYRFETDPDVDDFLTENCALYCEFGINLAKVTRMVWEVTSIPAAARKTESQIVEFIKNATGDIDTVRKNLFAVIACHSAIKAGDVVDRATAVELLERVFRLDALLCPHGRSFVFEISKDKLFREVGRTL